MKVVFDTRPESGYDDGAGRYHFPIKNYLPVATAALGDWVLYREPRRNGGRSAYVGIARLSSIDPDPNSSSHRYATVTDFLPFDTPVPLRGPYGYWEAPLRALTDIRMIGRTLQGKSVRVIAEDDFAAIVLAGLGDLPTTEAITASPNPETLGAMIEDAVLPVRRIQAVLANRKIRDAMFRKRIRRAYDDRCAVTGLRIHDTKGHSEIQAAHIWGVGEGGPDVVGNGLALCGTVHWLFDHHLIGLTEECRLIVAPTIPDALRALMLPAGQPVVLPNDPAARPKPAFLARRLKKFHEATGLRA